MTVNQEWNLLDDLFRRSLVAAFKAWLWLCRRFLRLIFPSAGFWAKRPRILCPGDGPPEGQLPGDYYDYRGIALPRELHPLTHAAVGVSLGRYLWPDGKQGPRLSLPVGMLHRNCAVVGPPGSGKTEGIIIPWIVDLLRSGGSVVTVDVKGDLVDRVSRQASRAPTRVWYWNSADPSRSMRWNWLATIQDHRDVEGTVQSILGRPRPNDPQPFFFERDSRWLRTLITITRMVHGHRARPKDLYRLLADQDLLRQQFRQHPSLHHYATEVADLLQFPLHEHSRAVSGLLNALHLFNTPNVAAVTERSDFTLADLVRQPTLLVVGASLADGRAAEILSSILLNQLVAWIYRRFAPGAASSSHPLYLVIDEAPRLRTRINLEELLSVGRAAAVGVCLAAQDVAQFGDERETGALFSNCLTFIALRGCSAATARYLESRLGQRIDRLVTKTRYRGLFDLFPNQIAEVVHTQPAPVLRAREIMYPPVNTFCGVVHAAEVSSKPFLADLTRA